MVILMSLSSLILSPSRVHFQSAYRLALSSLDSSSVRSISQLSPQIENTALKLPRPVPPLPAFPLLRVKVQLWGPVLASLARPALVLTAGQAQSGIRL